MKNEIKDLRKSIDRIDDEIAELLNQRTEIASKIICLKKNNSDNIEDTSRENSIIERLCNNNPKIEKLIRDIYRRVFDWVKNR